MSDERDEISAWLRWAQTMTAGAGRDMYPARRLINALEALSEGRSDPLFLPDKRSNTTKTKVERQIDVLIVASVDGLKGINVPVAEALLKVAKIAGKSAREVEDLRKKMSASSGKYALHRSAYDEVRRRITLGPVDRGMPGPSEKTILDNLALSIQLLRGRAPK